MEPLLTEHDLDVLNCDYAAGEVSRQAAARFAGVACQDLRLDLGLYRTESEQAAFIERGLAIRLPGQRSRPPQNRILRLAKYFAGIASHGEVSSRKHPRLLTLIKKARGRF